MKKIKIKNVLNIFILICLIKYRRKIYILKKIIKILLNNLNDENNMNINNLCVEICREILLKKIIYYSKILGLKKERKLKGWYNINIILEKK